MGLLNFHIRLLLSAAGAFFDLAVYDLRARNHHVDSLRIGRAKRKVGWCCWAVTKKYLGSRYMSPEEETYLTSISYPLLAKCLLKVFP